VRTKTEQLDEVLVALDRRHQRVTYAALGGVVELPAQSVMQGRQRAAINSWVVSKKTHLPTGYAARDCHPKLTSNPYVIEIADELQAWLAARP
jgi:hypothetical protein